MNKQLPVIKIIRPQDGKMVHVEGDCSTATSKLQKESTHDNFQNDQQLQDREPVQETISPIVIKPEETLESGDGTNSSQESSISTPDDFNLHAIQGSIQPSSSYDIGELKERQETIVRKENMHSSNKDHLQCIPKIHGDLDKPDTLVEILERTNDVTGQQYSAKVDKDTNEGDGANIIKQEFDIFGFNGIVGGNIATDDDIEKIDGADSENVLLDTVSVKREMTKGSLSNCSNRVDCDILPDIIKQDILDLYNIKNEKEWTKRENVTDNSIGGANQFGEAWIKTDSETQNGLFDDNKLIEVNEQPLRKVDDDLPQTGQAKVLRTGARKKRGTRKVVRKSKVDKHVSSTLTSGLLNSDMENATENKDMEICDSEADLEIGGNPGHVKIESTELDESGYSSEQISTKQENKKDIIDDKSKCGNEVTESTIFAEEWQKSQEADKPVTCQRYG